VSRIGCIVSSGWLSYNPSTYRINPTNLSCHAGPFLRLVALNFEQDRVAGRTILPVASATHDNMILSWYHDTCMMPKRDKNIFPFGHLNRSTVRALSRDFFRTGYRRNGKNLLIFFHYLWVRGNKYCIQIYAYTERIHGFFLTQPTRGERACSSEETVWTLRQKIHSGHKTIWKCIPGRTT
jgi:hypothetical protein